jgi:hypothetical protein
MKRWLQLAAVGGLFFALAVVVERLLRTGTSSADFWSWADFWSHLLPVILFEIAMALILLAIFWASNFLWREVRRKSQGDGLMEPSDLFAGRWRHAVELSAFAVILGRAADALLGVQTPGAFLLQLIFKLDVFRLVGGWVTLVLYFMTPIAVNSAIFFAILWGVYLWWLRVRRKAVGKNLEVGK